MVIRKKNDSDTESGEEKEDIYENEEDREYMNSLTELEREKIFNERYNQKLAKKERERILNEAKNIIRPEDNLTRKRAGKTEEEPIHKKPKFSELEYNHKKETGITLEDIEKIRISRDQLAKWCPHIYFEKTVIGAFVRINIGLSRSTRETIYLMCEVIDVTTTEKYYEIEGNKVKTNKMLVINHGKNKKTMKFDIVSNTTFTKKEFDAYMERLSKDGMKPITQHQVQTKIQAIQTALNYKYKREEIDELVQRQLQENLKKGKVEATATLELEKLKVQLEDLRNNEIDSLKPEEKREKIVNLENLIKQLENAIHYDDKIVESDIVLRLNEKNRNKQLEIDSKRV
jgi:RNA polymerase-associated protein RTF1